MLENQEATLEMETVDLPFSEAKIDAEVKNRFKYSQEKYRKKSLLLAEASSKLVELMATWKEEEEE